MKGLRIFTIALLLLVAVNALVAGYLFITDPTGTKMYIPVSMLEYSPFTNFLVPGIVLFIVNGIFNLVAAVFVTFQWKHFPFLVVLQGLLLTGWIAVQVILLREFNFLHALLGGTGIVLFTLGNRLNV
ncbi:MAG: hypothetical protein WAQ28_02145 [Bacteroidia bacterium]|jgi:hypothetical protein